MLKLKDEFDGCDFGDQRLNKRVIFLANKLSENPELSIHAACGSSSESKAAYRFLQHGNVSPKSLLEPHTQKTVSRIKSSQKNILVIQDTTDLIYTQFPSISNLGERHKAKGYEKGVKGIMLHSSLAVTQSGIPLGLLKQSYFTHDDFRKKRDSTKINTKGANKLIPFEEKESFRWVDHLESCNALGDSEAHRLIHVADRECDIYEFLQAADESQSKYVVRSSADRRTREGQTTRDISTIQKKLDIAKSIGSIQVIKDDQKIECEIKVVKVTLQPAQRLPISKPKQLTPLAISVVEVNSINDAPEKLHWRLLTNLECISFENAIQIVEIYKCRWTIECFHRILKSGFGVEKARLADRSRLENLASLLSIVSWHIFWLYNLSRALSSISAQKIFTEGEIKVLKISAKKLKVNIQNFDLATAVLILARLGGFAGRKSDGLPGMTNIWRGWRKLHERLEFMEELTYG